MEGMLVLMFPVGRERVCSGGNGKSLVCAVGLREIEVADVLWSLRRFYWDRSGGYGMSVVVLGVLKELGRRRW